MKQDTDAKNNGGFTEMTRILTEEEDKQRNGKKKSYQNDSKRFQLQQNFKGNSPEMKIRQQSQQQVGNRQSPSGLETFDRLPLKLHQVVSFENLSEEGGGAVAGKQLDDSDAHEKKNVRFAENTITQENSFQDMSSQAMEMQKLTEGKTTILSSDVEGGASPVRRRLEILMKKKEIDFTCEEDVNVRGYYAGEG